MSTRLPEKDQTALTYVWGKYRTFALTSRQRKKQLTRCRYWVLLLGIAGAVFGTLCQQKIHPALKIDETLPLLPTLLGWLSAASFGLAAFFGKEIANPEQERQWIRSRSMAEAFKREIYLFRTLIPPYHSDDKAEILLEQADALAKKGEDLPVANISETLKKEDLPTESMEVSEYIVERVREQIDDFYRPRVLELTGNMKQNKHIGMILGGIAVLLGAFGATSGWTAGWVAVISTIVASITAYAYAGRYQYLIVSYQATADKLERLLTQWEVKGRTDADTQERNEFIRSCEEVISIENSAWMAEMVKKQKQAPDN